MLRSIQKLKNYRIHATDGEIGHVADFYFDDRTWTIRYLVVDTGNWLPGRQVLIAPEALEQPNWDEELFPVNLTQEEIETSPSIAADKPVSHQHELALAQFYGWSPYWHDLARQSGVFATYMVQPSTKIAIDAAGKDDDNTTVEHDPHLRSSNEVTGYHIEALDGRIGHIDDFIIDDASWRLHYMVVDTGILWFGKKVLMSPTWVRAIKWPESLISVALSQQTIEDSPEYDPEQSVNRTYETVLYDYYGRSYYWQTEQGAESEERVKKNIDTDDPVDEAVWESFPASDPPPY